MKALNQKNSRFWNIYFHTFQIIALIVFSTTAISKIAALLSVDGTIGGKPYDKFSQGDYVIPLLTTRFVLYTASVVELSVVLVLLFSRSRRLRIATVLWLCSIFILYRTASVLLAAPEPCKCLGGLLDSFANISSATQREIIRAILLFLTGSSVLLLGYYNQGKSLVREMRTLLLRPTALMPILVLGCSFQCIAGTLTINGRLSPQTVNWGDSNARNPHPPFNFEIKRSENGMYLLNFESTHNIDGKRFECSLRYDGTNTTLVRRLTATFAGKWQTLSQPPQFVDVRPSPLPLFDMDPREGWPFVWMLFCADRLWEQSFTNQRPSLFEVPRKVEDFGYKWEWDRINSHALAPDRVRVVRDTSFDRELKQEIENPEVDYPSDVQWFQDAQRFYERRLKIPNGFCRIEMGISARVESGPFSVPTQTLFSVRTPADKDRPFYEYNISVLETKYSDSELSFPSLPSGIVVVTDARFRTMEKAHMINSIGYVRTNMMAIPEKTDRLLGQVTQINLAHSKRHSFTMLEVAQYVLASAILVLLLGGPLAVLWIRRIHRTNNRLKE